MRYFAYFLATALLIAGCKSNDKTGDRTGDATTSAGTVDSATFTTLQWIDSTKDFGTIEEGQKLEVSFRFKNTGNKPLVIARVQPSCGCTVAEQSKDPIPPGGEGQIKAVFNSQGHLGANHKTLYVVANTARAQNNLVQFTVNVEKKK